MIAIVDYGMGNIGSMANMVDKAGDRAVVTSSAEEIAKADRIILPGVGSFDAGMANLKSLGLVDVLTEMVLGRRMPLLGVCLGMQLLCDGSQEGGAAGLGWIGGKAVKFDFTRSAQRLNIPHMGWNTVDIVRRGTLFDGYAEVPVFYFAHSYHVVLSDQEDAAAVTEYGYRFPSALARGNIFGVQFHPEKSHHFGLQLLKNFIQCRT